MIRRKGFSNVSSESVKNLEQKTALDDEDVLELKIKINIGKKIIEADINESLYIPTLDKINHIMISNAMAEIPSLHARWNVLYNEAVYDYDIQKTRLEVWISRKSRDYRHELNKLEGSKVTEKMVLEAVQLDPEYQIISDGLAESKKNMKHVLALANGFGEKGEKLISIASMMKWEGENLANSRRTSSGSSYHHIQKSDAKRNVDEIEDKKSLDVNGGWPA